MPLGPEDITLTGKTLTGGTISGSTLSGGNLVGVGDSTIGGVRITTAVIAPNTNDGIALGSSALKFSDLYLAAGGVVSFSTDPITITAGTSALTVAASSLTHTCNQYTNSASTADIGSVKFTTGVIRPATNDGVALGTSAFKFSDLFLASGGVLQFSTEGTSITHSASVLTIAASTIVTNGVSQSTAAIYPTTSEGVSLGTSSNRWGGCFVSSGVNFPAAVDASADVNTLDDYEEGTFTPTFTPATTGTFTIGYNSATTGTYTKIGNMVYTQGFVQITTHTSGTGTGQMGISGLPFNAGGAPHQGVFRLANVSSGLRSPVTAIVTTAVNVARVQMGPVATTGATSALNLADLTTAGNQLNFSGSYMV